MPVSIIQKAIRLLNRHQKKAELLSGQLSIFRFFAFVLCIAGAFFFNRFWSIATFSTGFICFLLLVIFHAKVKSRLQKIQNRIRVHTETVSRIGDQWHENPVSFYNDLPQRLDDLAIEGRYSLIALLDRCRTINGSILLKRWLKGDFNADEITEQNINDRSSRVQVFSKKRPFRTEWFSCKTHHSPLPDFFKNPTNHNSSPGYYVSVLAAVLCLFTVFSWLAFQILETPAYFLISFPVQLIVAAAYAYLEHRSKSDHATGVLDSEALIRFSELVSISAKIRTTHPKISSDIQSIQAVQFATRQLYRIASIADLKRNPFLHFLFSILFLYRIHVNVLLRAWYFKHSEKMQSVVEILTSFDSLLCLSYLNDYRKTCIASLNNKGLMAKNLRHPLITDSRVTGNDLHIPLSGLWMISGSNMSGKSTFLRSIGLNLRLAMAGASVVADRFEFFPVYLQTSIDAVDNLESSESLFYAEVQKIKELVHNCEANKTEAFYLIDEMLRGTNAKERTIAAKSIIKHILSTGATGLITTHDSGILDLKDLFAQRIELFHFKESSRETLTFDYRIHPGPVEQGNALLILKKEGLPVE